MDDPRFNKLLTDPKYRSAPKKERKVKIDPRFQSLFKDKKFVSKVGVDKRGRPGNYSTKENFEKFYQLDSSDEDSSDEEGKVEQPKSAGKLKKPNAKKRIEKDSNIDYARGEAFLTDSSSEEESTDDEDQVDQKISDDIENEAFDKWGELDHDAETTDEATKRLAVCNMDWDRVHADDLTLVLSSFCPPGGRVLKVSIYLSEFGKERLAEEDKLGPEELRRAAKKVEDDDESEDEPQDDAQDDAQDMERVRKHQINRLKYYYAVAEFNSPIAANRVYTQCDGNEYELSGTRFDLRFIPEDMTFDEEPKEFCNKVPDVEKYKPKFFETSALSKGKVDLTWDEQDPQRLAAMQKAFEDDEDNEEQLKQYLASSDDEDESKEKLGSEESDADDEEAAAKYKALLLGGLGQNNDEDEENDSNEEEEGGMEMTFAADDDIKEKAKAKAVESMTPWEKYLHKKKEKRKHKKEKRNEKNENKDEGKISDDELPSDVDLSDPFFQMEDKPKANKKSSKLKNKKKSQNDSEEKSNNLELLAMDSDDDKAHFDYKEIVKNETKKKKKKKNNKNSKVASAEDNFELDFADNRFADIFSNPKYNVDPSHPSFKKTKSMKSIIDEKQKRILQSDQDKSSNEPQAKKSKKHSSLDLLANQVKSKSDRMKRKRK